MIEPTIELALHKLHQAVDYAQCSTFLFKEQYKGFKQELKRLRKCKRQLRKHLVSHQQYLKGEDK